MARLPTRAGARAALAALALQEWVVREVRAALLGRGAAVAPAVKRVREVLLGQGVLRGREVRTPGTTPPPGPMPRQ